MGGWVGGYEDEDEDEDEDEEDEEDEEEEEEKRGLDRRKNGRSVGVF
jgi:hypothetical protein